MPRANDPSLPGHARARILALVPHTEAPDRSAEYAEMLARAEAEAARRPHTPKHRRDRHGMYGIRGGLAALLPVVPAHGAAAPVVTAAAAWRVWCSPRAAAVATALLLGIAGASWNPTAAVDGGHLATCPAACREAWQDRAQAAMQRLTWPHQAVQLAISRSSRP